MKAKPPAPAEQREYLARGRITLDGVVFTIMASSQDEAEAKAACGAWHDYDAVGASSADCHIHPSTIEPNE